MPSLSHVPGEEIKAKVLASKDMVGVGVYLGREKQINSKTRINRVQGSGLWASASLAVPQANSLGLSSEAAQESEGCGRRGHIGLAGQSVPYSLLAWSPSCNGITLLSPG